MQQTDIASERQQLELDVHNALWALSDYFKKKDDPLQYEVNRLWQGLDKLRAIPEFPKPQQC